MSIRDFLQQQKNEIVTFHWYCIHTETIMNIYTQKLLKIKLPKE